MSVVTTPSTSVLNNELTSNGPITIYSSSHKPLNGGIESVLDGESTIKNHIESKLSSSSNQNGSSPGKYALHLS